MPTATLAASVIFVVIPLGGRRLDDPRHDDPGGYGVLLHEAAQSARADHADPYALRLRESNGHLTACPGIPQTADENALRAAEHP